MTNAGNYEKRQRRLQLLLSTPPKNEQMAYATKQATNLHKSHSYAIPIGRQHDSLPGITKTLKIGAVAFVLGALCAGDAGNTSRTQKPTESNETRHCTNSGVALQDQNRRQKVFMRGTLPLFRILTF